MHPSSVSIFTNSESNNSKYSEASMDNSVEEREAAKARASFVMEKHSPGMKQITFEDTIIAIQPDESLEDEPVYVEDEGIHI